MNIVQAAWRILGLGCGGALPCALAISGAHAQEGSPSLADLRALTLEELSQVNVATVQRRTQPLTQAPGAIYVVTDEDIRRSGATSLPEALRLAPNLQVARDTANQWAISARGFNSFETSNKLLVLVDSRSIYHPLFAGVLWDEEHVLIEDIERIEVVSGPGGALWGANAVNGVINVITRSSEETHGVAARATLGTLDSTATARIGAPLGRNGHFRVYGSAFDFDNTLLAGGGGAEDDYGGVFGGVRADWRFGGTALTLQAEAFDDNILGGGNIWGGYVRGRITHDFERGHRLFVQAYYDASYRKDPFLDTNVRASDITFQHSWAPVGRHQIIAGGGYRSTQDEYGLTGPFTLDPAEKTVNLLNGFVQDTIAITDSLNLTLGVKVEDSSFSGTEFMPSGRLAWTPGASTLLWAAVSRAMRTPARLDRDLMAPGIFIGGPSYGSEELIAYEAGYRGQPHERLNLNVTLFLHDYDNLRTTTSLPGADTFPAQFTNDLRGQLFGVEAWADVRLTGWWMLRAGLTALEKDFEIAPGANDIANPPSTGNDPSHQVLLRSRMNVTDRLAFDAGARWIDSLPNPAVPGYVELDARLAWQATDRLRLSIVGTNLLHDDHPESSAVGAPNRIRRGVFIDANWGF